jgi:hypothetical protein
VVLLQVGKVDEALKAARAITNFHARAKTLATIVAAEAKAGHASEASVIFAEAVAAGRGPKEPMPRVYALQPGADEQASAGLKADAAATQLVALKEAQAIKQDGMRQIALSIVAMGQARIGAIADAQQTVQTIGDMNSRATPLAEIVAAQAEAGAIGDATRTAEAIVDKERLARALAAIAVAQAKRGDAKPAGATFDQVLAAARSIADEGHRAIALAYVASGEAKAGRGAESTARFAEAMKTAPQNLMFLGPIGQEMIQSGDLADAFTLAATLDEQNRLDLLEGIAARQVEAHDFSGALKTAQMFNDAPSRAKLLAEIAEGLPN